jgi:hypothetical protein
MTDEAKPLTKRICGLYLGALSRAVGLQVRGALGVVALVAWGIWKSVRK